MPDITILQSTFERLQQHAKPLVDTTDTVVNRALDALEQREGYVVSRNGLPIPERSIDPGTLPDLKHTKVLSASLAGGQVVKPNWNVLVDRILVHSMEQCGDFGELRKLCPVNLVPGRKEDDGYRYLSEINISVQGLSANDACKALVIAAQSLGIELEITFMWRPKEDAACPGERAYLRLPDAMLGEGTH